MQPVYASKFLTKLQPEEQAIAIKGGIVPVNDIYMGIWRSYCQINLLFGGRGGGKSESIFDKLIIQCIENEYFNCYYGRKVWDTIRKSCFETIVTSIKKLGVRHLFTFSESDNSSMIIRCKKNGNKFEPFGASNPDGIKSIKDPTHIVCEEFDQFDFKDFQEILPTLRTIRADTEFWGMFNTKDVLPSHWIMLVFFPEMYVGDIKQSFDALQGMPVRKIFANYYDNYFLNHEEYLRILRIASGGNQILFDSIANGAWGVIENGNPWLHAFTHGHIRDIPFFPEYPIYLSFDFNNDPFACIAFQMSPDKGGDNSFIHILNEFVGVMKLEDMCQRIRTEYPNSIIYITGDRSGQNEDIGRNQTLYQMIAGYLNIAPKCLNLNNTNLTHADSRLLCNVMFHNYPHIHVHSRCKNLIADCQKATIDFKTDKPSKLLKDRENYKMDAFDAMRYFFQTYFNEWAKEVYMKIMLK